MKQFLLNLPVSRLFLILNASTVSFLILIGVMIYLISHSQLELERRFENRYNSYLLADELRQNSDDLTRFARLYVVTQDPRFEQYYLDILDIQNGQKPRPADYHRIYWDFYASTKTQPRENEHPIALETLMREQGFTDAEMALLQESKKLSDDLVNTEVAAMNAVKGIFGDTTGVPDLELARNLMHNRDYLKNVALIMEPIDKFYNMFDARTRQEVEVYRNKTTNILLALTFTLTITVLLMVLSFIVIRIKIQQPLNVIYRSALSGFARKIDIVSSDEFGVLANAINTVSRDIEVKSSFVTEVGEGNLTKDLTLLNQDDSLGKALIKMRNDLRSIRQEEERRNWAAQGLAKFNDILHKGNTMTAICDEIVSTVVKYVEANIGCIFLVNEEGGHVLIELKATYGYGRKKYLQKEILPGEGLVGQCFLEGNALYLTEVPQNYVQITSGLGGIRPSSVLIVPMKMNEKVVGLLELAALREIEAYKIAFIEKMSENFASTITMININERTQRLLQDSQIRAEELKAQEEEMRQNMEELAATQEELQRKEKFYLEKLVQYEKVSVGTH